MKLMGQPAKEVEEWTERLLNDTTEEGSIVRIDLHHAIDGGSSELLGRVQVRDDQQTYEVSQELWDMASADSESRMVGQMQRYVMLAFRAKGEEPDARLAFLIGGKAHSDLMGGATEGPTPPGHLGQLMRHNERLHGMMMQLSETTSGRMARDLEAERLRRMKLEEIHMKQFEMLQELSDRKHERDMEIRQEEKKNERHEQIMGMLMTMAPLIASKVLGPAGTAAAGPSLPAAGARDESIHQFLKTLDEQQVGTFLAALRPDQQIPLMEIYQAHMEEEKRRDGTDIPEKGSN
jgi:hypothetical protein